MTIRWYRSTDINSQNCQWSGSVNTVSHSTNVKYLYTMQFPQIILNSRTDVLFSCQNYHSDCLHPLKQSNFLCLRSDGPNPYNYRSRVQQLLLLLVEVYQQNCRLNFISYLFYFQEKEKNPINSKPPKNSDFLIYRSTYVCCTICRS